MPKLLSEDILEINKFLWWGGWRPIQVGIITVVGSFFAAGFADGLFGAFQGHFLVITLIAGPIWWYKGVRHINDNYQAVLSEYNDYTEEVGEEFLDLTGENPKSYFLTDSNGVAPLVKPAKRFYTTTLIVGDSSVAINEGIGLNMVSRRASLDDDTQELYYDQISSVSYSRPNLEIATSDGGTLQFKSTRSPDDALNDLQNRLREYKSVQSDSRGRAES